MFKETRRIDANKVRNLCIKNRYYTKGNNKEYENLLINLCGGFYDNNKNMTIKRIEKIAIDIYNHTPIEDFEKYNATKDEIIANIMFELINDCCYSCIDIVD